jgi:AcrR family transcriptional regulator
VEVKGRREQFLEASARVFAKKGYFAASVSDIIEEAGVARGTFYLYFSSKRQVFAEVLHLIIEKIEAIIRGPNEGDPSSDVFRRLTDNVARVIAFFVENPDYAKIILTQAPGLDEEASHQLDQATFMLQAVMDGLLRRGWELGLLRAFNVELASSVLLGGIKELLYHLVITKQIDAPLDVVVENLVRIQAAGILRPALAETIPELADGEKAVAATPRQTKKPTKGKPHE